MRTIRTELRVERRDGMSGARPFSRGHYSDGKDLGPPQVPDVQLVWRPGGVAQHVAAAVAKQLARTGTCTRVTDRLTDGRRGSLGRPAARTNLLE